MREVRKEIRPNRAVFEPGERGGLRRSLVRAGWIATGAAAALVFPAAAWAGDDQNALHPASKQEHSISVLWWVLLAGCSIGFAVIVVLLFLGWVRRNRDSLPFGGRDRAGTLPGQGACLAASTSSGGAPRIEAACWYQRRP